MTAEDVSALASVGTLAVVAATAVAAFVQLRHLSVTNSVAVLNTFREEYERVQEAVVEAMPAVLERLRDAAARREFMDNAVPAWVRPIMPMMRLMETLGNYTNRNIVPRDLVCDQWSPVVSAWWDDCAPVIAVMRRRSGPTLFEHWEAIAVLSRRWLDEERGTYPKRLPRIELVDPWLTEDAGEPASGAAPA